MIKIKVQVLMTGSDGNCCLVTHKNTTILIDAGFQTKKKMEEILEETMMKYKIDGIIITHEHTDHLSQWTGRLSLDYMIPIYLNEYCVLRDNNRKNKFFTVLDRKSNEEKIVETIKINENEEFQIGDIKIYPFNGYHDVKTYGFRFNDDQFVYLSDCGFLSNNIKKELLKVKNIALEFNYDKEKIINSTRNWQNKDRTLDQFGHLSNEEAVDFLIFAQTQDVEYKNIITLHGSNLHNSKELIEKELKRFNKSENTNIYISNRENNEEIELGD